MSEHDEPVKAIPTPVREPGYSGKAVSVLTLGLISSLVPLIGIFPGVVAVVRSRSARREIRESAGYYRGNNLVTSGLWLAWSGILSTLIIVGSLVWGVSWLMTSPALQQLTSEISSLSSLSTNLNSLNGGLSNLGNLGDLGNINGSTDLSTITNTITGTSSLSGVSTGSITASESSAPLPDTTGLTPGSLSSLESLQNLLKQLNGLSALFGGQSSTTK
jgi:hypothetical protein